MMRLHGGILYIGETGRTIGSCIKEHLSIDKQTVFQARNESQEITGQAQFRWYYLQGR